MTRLERVSFNAKKCFLHAYSLLVNFKRYGSEEPYPFYSYFGILFLGQIAILRKYFGVDDVRIAEPTSVQKFCTDNRPVAALATMG